MAEGINLIAETRKESGSSISRRLRKTGKLPGIINNKKGESIPISIVLHDFEMMLQHHSSESLLLDIVIDGNKSKKILLRDVQHDSITGHILHVDFIEISMKEKMNISVNIALIGEPSGVTQEGGIMEQLLRHIEIECMPIDLVEEIEVDVSDLKIGDTILVSNLNIDPKLTVLTNPDIAIVSILTPRVEEEAESSDTGEESEPTEPEVIGEKQDKASSEAENKGRNPEK